MLVSWSRIIIWNVVHENFCGDRNILYLDYGDGYRSFGLLKLKSLHWKWVYYIVSKWHCSVNYMIYIVYWNVNCEKADFFIVVVHCDVPLLPGMVFCVFDEWIDKSDRHLNSISYEHFLFSIFSYSLFSTC